MYEGQNGGFSSNAADMTNTVANDPGMNMQTGNVRADSGL